MDANVNVVAGERVNAGLLAMRAANAKRKQEREAREAGMTPEARAALEGERVKRKSAGKRKREERKQVHAKASISVERTWRVTLGFAIDVAGKFAEVHHADVKAPTVKRAVKLARAALRKHGSGDVLMIVRSDMLDE